MTFARDLANFADISANNLTFRNLIINGAMQVAQRATSVASITTTDYRTVDRWKFAVTSQGTWTMSQENDGPDGSGFKKSTKVLCTTADASPAAGDNIQFWQGMEGQNLQQLLKGTSSAKPLTVSFWVKSNVTGTYIAELEDTDNSRSVSASYTISSSATWEKKTITFPADTTGALDNDNAGSLYLEFWLGAGSNYTSSTLQTTWGSLTSSKRAVGQTNLAAATNNYWQITGVQLEIGSSASAYEFKPYDVELAQCQRYYWRSTPTSAAFQPIATGFANGTTGGTVFVYNPVSMRAGASSIEYSTLSVGDYANPGIAVTSLTLDNAGPLSNAVSFGVSSGLTQFRPYGMRNNNSTSGYIGFSAEL